MSKLAAISRVMGLGTMSPEVKRIGMHALALTVVAGGGAATGYIVGGTRRGAVTGSLVHLGLFGLAGAAMGGGRLTTSERIGYGVLGLGATVGVGYLWMQRRTA